MMNAIKINLQSSMFNHWMSFQSLMPRFLYRYSTSDSHAMSESSIIKFFPDASVIDVN